MTEDQLDKFLKNKLLKYSSAVPEDMWQRIKQKKDKDRKAFFFKWTSALILISFLIGSYFIFHSTKNADIKEPISSNKQNIVIQKDPEIAEQTLPKETTKVSSAPTDINQKNNGILSNKKFDNSERNKNYIFSVKGQHKKIKTSQSIKGSINAGINNASDSSINDSQANENIIKESPGTNIKKQDTRISLQKDSSAKKILTQSQNKNESKLSPIKNKNWFLELYASPDIPFFEITQGSATMSNTTKRAPASYTIGIKVSRYFAKRFFVKTGIQYSQINEKFLDSIFLVDHYRSIDIPFLIGYDLSNDHFKTTINAGIIYNLYTWYKGQTYFGSQGLIDINAANIYKHNTGISLYVGLSFAKLINDKIQLFAEPYFRYRLSYMTKPQAPFNQKINVAGISFGVKYNF